MTSHLGPSGPNGHNTDEQEQTWDAVETSFARITACSLDDGECITRCVEQLKDADE